MLQECSAREARVGSTSEHREQEREQGWEAREALEDELGQDEHGATQARWWRSRWRAVCRGVRCRSSHLGRRCC